MSLNNTQLYTPSESVNIICHSSVLYFYSWQIGDRGSTVSALLSLQYSRPVCWGSKKPSQNFSSCVSNDSPKCSSRWNWNKKLHYSLNLHFMSSAVPKCKYMELAHIVSSHIQIVLLLTSVVLFAWPACFWSSQMSVKVPQTLGKINQNIWVSSAFIAQWERLNKVMKV